MRSWLFRRGSGPLLLSGLALLSLLIPASLSEQSGTASVTQGGVPASRVVFSDTWDSLRTFPLTHRLRAPLKVYIDHHGAYRPDFRNYILHGLALWSNALDGRLTYVFVNRRNQADITVDWVPRFNDPYVAGLTTYGIGYARMEIRTVGVPEKDIKANIIHELGHALGIAGHSRNSGDIMVATRRWRRGDSAYDPTLSPRDVRAIRLLYSNAWHKGEDLYSARGDVTPETPPSAVADSPPQLEL
jgi:hypothetical protein